MNLRALKPLREAGVSWAEIARIAGCDPRTAKKYLAERGGTPPRYGPRRRGKRIIDPFTEIVDTWLRAEPRLLATVIHERLSADPYNFPGSYQRVKEYVRHRRPEILAELECDDEPRGFHRRFEVVAGGQAQVDWGEEEPMATPVGTLPVYSFHMGLSYSRDPFCRFTHAQDLGTFWGLHTQAFSHFGGVPGVILYDHTKTVVRRHVGRGKETPLHPEAIAFADHYGFAIELCAPGRPETKGRVERLVAITRQHVLAGRTFASLEEMQRAWEDWVPHWRGRVHRTHGEVIAERAARDRAALLPLPPHPYVVCDRHIRTVGTDALVHFEASVYSVPWREVRPRQKVELRVTRDEVGIWTIGADPVHLATHPRARRRGAWVVDERHWDGLPGGHHPNAGPLDDAPEGRLVDPDREADLAARLCVEVATRSLRAYDQACHERGGAW